MKRFVGHHFTMYVLIIPAVLFTLTASGQFVSVPTKVSTPRGNVTVPTQVYLPMYHNYSNRPTNKKHVFTIVLLNDSTLEAKAKINISDSVHSLKWGKKENERIIMPSDTKEIYRIADDGRKITGLPRDSCWIFLVEEGRIRKYSITSETDYPTVAFIQKEGIGSIVSLTKENLLGMVGDNERAVSLAKKGKLLKAIDLYNEE